MSRLIYINKGKNYLCISNDNLEYSMANGEKKNVPLKDKPVLSFINPKGLFSEGKIQVQYGNTIDLVPFRGNDAASINAFNELLKKEVENYIDSENNDVSSAFSDPNGTHISNGIIIKNSCYHMPAYKAEIIDIAKNFVSPKEIISIMLKGTNKEYLICTDYTLYIYKTGFMTGHTFGNGIFSISLKDITNLYIDFHFMSGYFIVSGAGIENTYKNYWSNDRKENPQESPNTISLASDTKEAFEYAIKLLNNTLIPNAKGVITKNELASDNNIPSAPSLSNLRELKKLLDEGILTQEEFDTKKKQILGI